MNTVTQLLKYVLFFVACVFMIIIMELSLGLWAGWILNLTGLKALLLGLFSYGILFSVITNIIMYGSRYISKLNRFGKYGVYNVAWPAIFYSLYMIYNVIVKTDFSFTSNVLVCLSSISLISYSAMLLAVNVSGLGELNDN